MSAVFLNASQFLLRDGSVWNISMCQFQYSGPAPAKSIGSALQFLLGNISVLNSSSWLWSGVVIQSNGAVVAMTFMSVTMIVSHKSSWTISSTQFYSVARSSAWFSGDGQAFISLDEGSQWLIVDCIFESSLQQYALWFATYHVVIARGSCWRWSTSSFSTKGPTTSQVSTIALSKQTQISVIWNSSWIIEQCVADIVDGSIVSTVGIINAFVTISSGSEWLIVDCAFTVASDATGSPLDASSALDFSFSDITVIDGSSWVVERVKLANGSVAALYMFTTIVVVRNGSEWRIERVSAIGTTSPSFILAGGSVTIGAVRSLWSIVNSTFVTYSSTAASMQWSCAVSVSSASAIVIRSNRFRSMSARASTALDLSGVTKWIIFDSSMLHFARNELSLPATTVSGACLTLPSKNIQLGQLSSIRLLEITCFTISPMSQLLLRGGSIDTTSTGMGHASVVQRCSRVNGDVVGSVLPRVAWNLPCGHCDVQADCFHALTKPVMFTQLPCDEYSSVVCPCIPMCGGIGNLCLPGQASPALPLPDQCVYNTQARPDLPTRSTSNESRSRTASPALTETAVLAESAASSLWRLTALADAALSTSVVLSGVSVATALQKVLAQQTLNNCASGVDLESAPDFASSPTQLLVGTSDDGGYIRGTVLGNILLLLGCAAASAISCCALSVLHNGATLMSLDKLSAEATKLCLPGILWVPYSMILVPTITSSVTLLSVVTAGRGTRPLGIIGLAASLIPFLFLMICTSFKSQFHAAPVSASLWEKRQGATGNNLMRWTTFFLPRHEWVDARQRWHGFVSRWSSLFDPYGRRRQWFGVIETGTGLATAVLAGLTPIDGNDSTCSFLQTAAAAVAAAFFVAVVALRPYSAQSDFALSVMNSGLTALASILGIAGTDTSSVASAQIVMNNFGTAAMVIAFCVDERLDSFIEQVRQVVKNTRVVAQVNWLTLHRRHGKRPSLRPSTKRIGEDAAAMLAAEFRGRHLNEPCPAESSRVALACIICTICDERQSINRFNTHSAASLATPEPFT